MRIKIRSRNCLNRTLRWCQKGIEIIKSFRSPPRVASNLYHINFHSRFYTKTLPLNSHTKVQGRLVCAPLILHPCSNPSCSSNLPLAACQARQASFLHLKPAFRPLCIHAQADGLPRSPTIFPHNNVIHVAFHPVILVECKTGRHGEERHVTE